MKLGFIGLGRMGAAIAQRIVAAGCPLLVWNRSEHKSQPLVTSGATLARRCNDVFDACDVILLMTDAEGTRAILSDRSARKGRLVIAMGTQLPADSVALELEMQATGGLFLEAPLLGTVEPATEGTLIALVGGDRAHLPAVKPILGLFTKEIIYTGGVGTAAGIKLATNLLLSNYWTILGETLALAQSSGVDPALAIEILIRSAAANGLLAPKASVLVDNRHTVAFDIAGMARELDTTCRLAASSGLRMPVTTLSTELASRVIADGGGARDVAALALYACFEARP